MFTALLPVAFLIVVMVKVFFVFNDAQRYATKFDSNKQRANYFSKNQLAFISTAFAPFRSKNGLISCKVFPTMFHTPHTAGKHRLAKYRNTAVAVLHITGLDLLHCPELHPVDRFSFTKCAFYANRVNPVHGAFETYLGAQYVFNRFVFSAKIAVCCNMLHGKSLFVFNDAQRYAT